MGSEICRTLNHHIWFVGLSSAVLGGTGTTGEARETGAPLIVKGGATA